MAKASKKKNIAAASGTVDTDAGTATIHGANGEIPCAADESITGDEQGDDLGGDGDAE